MPCATFLRLLSILRPSVTLNEKQSRCRRVARVPAVELYTESCAAASTRWQGFGSIYGVFRGEMRADITAQRKFIQSEGTFTGQGPRWRVSAPRRAVFAIKKLPAMRLSAGRAHKIWWLASRLCPLPMLWLRHIRVSLLWSHSTERT